MAIGNIFQKKEKGEETSQNSPFFLGKTIFKIWFDCLVMKIMFNILSPKKFGVSL